MSAATAHSPICDVVQGLRKARRPLRVMFAVRPAHGHSGDPGSEIFPASTAHAVDAGAVHAAVALPPTEAVFSAVQRMHSVQWARWGPQPEQADSDDRDTTP
jgi:hypothetical protein